MFARAMHSPRHPILAQIVPMRRCNLACTYCNEFDARLPARPPPGDAPPHRPARRARHHHRHHQRRRADAPPRSRRHHRATSAAAACIAALITNGYLLTPERIRRLNRAGLDYLQISIDNVTPDETSKKSLKVLDRKLDWLAEHAASPSPSTPSSAAPCATRQDALTDRRTRARELGLTSTVGILHDGAGQLRPLAPDHAAVYERILELGQSLFSFAQYDRFQRNIARGLPNHWHCRAGGRFLYICEDGLVHYCSQQRGHPGIPLEAYTPEHLETEAARPKSCAPLCTISCVHQTAMLDEFREHPRETLAAMIARRREFNPAYRPPPLLNLLTWIFLDHPNRGALARLALHLLRAKS